MVFINKEKRIRSLEQPQTIRGHLIYKSTHPLTSSKITTYLKHNVATEL